MKLSERQLVCAEVLLERGWSMRRTAKELGVDESTLRYRMARRQAGPVDGRSGKPELCDPFAAVIAVWLERQQDVPRPESVRSLYEELVLEHGFAGSYKAVLRYVRRRIAPPPVRPKRRVETRPGAQAQVDWLETRLHIEELGGLIELSAFLMTLSHSRMWALIWSLTEDLLSWLHCHNEAFLRLGGLPLLLRIDNLRTAVAAGGGSWATLNAGYESYCRQLGVFPDPCRIRRPSDKGKVERRGRDVKWLQVREGERFTSLETLQTTSDARIQARAGRLICPVTGRTVLISWEEEKLVLQPLPVTLPVPFDVQVSRVVGADCLVNFEGRQYAVPFTHVGRSVEVRGCARTVAIFSQNELLVTYPRHTQCRLLLDQRCYEGEGTDRVLPPTPLGRRARQIVLPRSWEAPRRPIDQYELTLRSLQ